MTSFDVEYLAKRPVSTIPTIPPPAWTAKTCSGSSGRKREVPNFKKKTTKADIAPKIVALQTGTWNFLAPFGPDWREILHILLQE